MKLITHCAKLYMALPPIIGHNELRASLGFGRLEVVAKW